MNISNQIRMLQASRGLNDSQTAEKIGILKQNYSRKLKNQTFNIDDLERIANALDYELNISFKDRLNGKIV